MKTINEQQLIELCKEQRIEGGFSIQDVRKVTGLTQAVVSRIEATQKAPSTHVYFTYVGGVMKLTRMKCSLEG